MNAQDRIARIRYDSQKMAQLAEDLREMADKVEDSGEGLCGHLQGLEDEVNAEREPIDGDHGWLAVHWGELPEDGRPDLIIDFPHSPDGHFIQSRICHVPSRFDTKSLKDELVDTLHP